ncbi:MAG: ABC transporter permease [Candidatus Pacebacteria bacterium]|nr:ABC transporter permease [Candidatus Paceibacterota bacterium]
MFLSFRRIIKTGFVNFWRNGFVSVSSIVVMTITLFVLGSLFFLNALLDSSLTTLKEKVDVNAYFVIDAPEERILDIQKQLESLPEVARVEYTSRDIALEKFKERHAEDAIELQAIKELGDNPLLASLSIKAKDPSQYGRISTFLETNESTLSKDGASIIAKVNFKDNRVAIEKLQQVIQGIEVFGLVLSSALIAISIVIVFNTIRMAIYISREEIAVMRLVGASDAYIRGPFVFEGAMYGVIATLITLVSFYPLAIWLGPATQNFFGNVNLFKYYTQHFGQIFLTLMATGMFLGALSSFLAVKKYLRI